MPRHIRRAAPFFLVIVAGLSMQLLPAKLESNRKTSGAGTSAATTVASAALLNARVSALAAQGGRELHFEANFGQASSRIKFIARGRQSSYFLGKEGATIALMKNPPTERPRGLRPDSRTTGAASDRHATMVRMTFPDADYRSPLVGTEQLPTRSNYYLGPPTIARFAGDPPKRVMSPSSIRNIPNYARVVQRDIYPGIDVVYYGTDGQMEYDFVVAPGADPSYIKLKFTGAQRLEIDTAGDLVVHTSDGDLIQRRPRIYEKDADSQRQLPGGYSLRANGEVTFELSGHDLRYPLVIDPRIVYSTYFGGAADESASGVAVDAQGNAYIAVTTTTTNPQTFNMTNMASIAKFDSTGKLLFTENLESPSCDSVASAITLDSKGNAYITGWIDPINPQNAGGCNNTENVLAVKVDPSGTEVYNTYFPGQFSTSEGNGIAVDSAGNAYVTGQGGQALQGTPGAYNTTAQIGPFVSKLDGAGSILYLTYLGGGSQTSDAGNAIAVDSSGNAYITGLVIGSIPLQNAFDSVPNASLEPEAFVAVFNSTGSGLIYSTLIAGRDGTGEDVGNGIALDPPSRVPVNALPKIYITGETSSHDFPVTSGAFKTTCGSDGTCNITNVCNIGSDGMLHCFKQAVFDAFIAKLDPNQNGAASLVYATFLGGLSEDEGKGIAVDASGNAYVTGYTASPDFQVLNSLQPFSNNQDVFATELDPLGRALVFSTFIGGNQNSAGNAIALDSNTGIYVVGSTSATDFPVQNAYQPTYGGGNTDAFITKLNFHRMRNNSFDFDGDGMADAAVFRPSTGTWYAIPSSNPGKPIVQQWGTNRDIPVPGDYDGDGKADFAIFRPSTGQWFIIASSNPGSPIVQQWGTSGDIPVPGDYDGDGKTDFAVFRPSTGEWYVVPSGNPGSPIAQQWGTSGDIPVPGDYDGDGKADFAIFRPSSGQWFVIASSNPGNPIVQQWGTNGDIPVPADYDGDGKTDVAVWRPSNGSWYVIPSSSPSTPTVTGWGANGDVPIEKPVGQ